MLYNYFFKLLNSIYEQYLGVLFWSNNSKVFEVSYRSTVSKNYISMSDLYT